MAYTYSRTAVVLLASACSIFIMPTGAAHALDVSVGGSNGVNASVGASSSRSGGLGANVGASVGGSRGVNANTSATVGGSRSLATANVNASIGGGNGINANVGATVGNSVGANVGVGIGGGGVLPGNGTGTIAPGAAARELSNMSSDDQRRMLVRCRDVSASGGYDAGLASLCKMLRTLAAR